jgi:hypothetical protein
MHHSENPALQPEDLVAPVIVRATAHDQYEGLKGHEYILARGLGKMNKLVQTSAQATAARGAK